jgi:beta-glucosidase
MALLDDKVRRNLRVLFSVKATGGRKPGAINTPAHQQLARRVAEEGIVLLKNDGGILPLDSAKLKTIAVIGDNAVTKFAGGGGSAGLKALYEITPLDGIVARVGNEIKVTFSQGYRQPIRNPWGAPDPAGVRQSSEITVSSPEEVKALADEAVQAAKAADVVIFVAGLNHQRNFDAEGSDRFDLKLPSHQDELLARVAGANPRTIVVLVSGAPVEMEPWLAKAPAVLQAWYLGTEDGTALAGTLFGDVNPSGKLPFTFPKQLADSPAHALDAYPGANGTVRYEEGLLVGYRWFDAKNVEPLFPFGHGLSYTAFEYSGLQISKRSGGAPTDVVVECEITNTGARAGSDIAQVYVEPIKPSVLRPLKELKGFAKVRLEPGAKQKVSIPLNLRSFAFYDPDKKTWVAERGAFKILIGSSSRDLRLTAVFDLSETASESSQAGK